MKAIYKNPFNDTIFQLVEVVSKNDEANTTTIIGTGGIVSVNSSRLITIPEFIAILEKELQNEMDNITT